MDLNQSRNRVFVYGSLMRNLQNLHKLETDNFLGVATPAPLYVMLHAAVSGNLEAAFSLQESLEQGELVELEEDDLELIQLFDSHPEFFRRRNIQLDDGSEAVAYELAQQKLYTIHRVTDETDWQMVMQTYDPTWMVGPSPLSKRKIRQKKKIR